MKTWIIVITLALASNGCTSVALQNHTVNQSLTVSDLRYQQVMDDLAILADNPGNLISFSIIDSGTAVVQDMVSGDATTLWDHTLHGFAKETWMLSGKRSPDLSWTLSPVVSEPQLAGIRCACLWQLYGPPPANSECFSLLRAPMYGEYTGYHLAVADQLGRIPPGWLHFGLKKDVPKHAIYSACCHDKYIWVCSDGMAGLSDFTLVLLDIATLDPTSLALKPPYLSMDTLPADAKQEDKPKAPKVSKVTDNVPAKQVYDIVNGQILPGKITVHATAWPSVQAGMDEVSPAAKPGGGGIPTDRASTTNLYK